jgi:phage-related tail protein
MMQPFEAADDEMGAEDPVSPGTEGADDARLGGLLNSLSGQVSEAFSQLSKIHAEVCSAREAVERRERERARELASQREALAAQQDSLERERSEMDLLRASVAATSAELGRRADLTERMERELEDRSESLAREAQRIADLSDDLNRRSELLAARERVIDGFFAMLGRMQSAIVAPTVAEIEEAAAAVENPEPMPVAETASESTSDNAMFMPNEMEQVDVAMERVDVANGTEVTSESASGHDDGEEPTPVVDLSDFTDDERATFAVRRRLRAYSDAFLAAEIRAERNGGKNGKKKRWF